MDFESVASLAGKSVVTALTSKVVGEAISKITAVFNKQKPAAEVAAKLERSQAAIKADPGNSIGETYVWKLEFLGLLREHPEVLADVQALAETLATLAGEELSNINQTVISSKGVTQVGRDMIGASETRKVRKRWRW
ncbi:hypothetical protein [Actinoallomurus sp. NPDC052274]|uniref:hypothetical protein n=1 Tax=Actinoallomurus sp. NPDC052274 TaxID=3155420 RepID=UPI003439C6F6